MKTPAGKECAYYYEDFHRGRSTQECRVDKALDSSPWQPRDCAKCPVPAILMANSSPNLQLEIRIKPTFLGFGRKLTVQAHCRKHDIDIENPYTGCVECNKERPGLSLFAEALGDIDD